MRTAVENVGEAAFKSLIRARVDRAGEEHRFGFLAAWESDRFDIKIENRHEDSSLSELSDANGDREPSCC